MFNIAKNGIITLTAGDTFKAPLYIFSKKLELFKLTDQDTLYFSIMEPNQPFEYGIIRKIYSLKDLNNDKSIFIELDPEDTENLHSGTYYYEIKLRRVDNGKELVDTIVPKTKLFLL